MKNNPALFAFKTAEEGGYYLENQKELNENGKPYVGVVNGFAVMQATPNASVKMITLSNILVQTICVRRANSEYFSIPATSGIVLVTVEGDATYKVIVK